MARIRGQYRRSARCIGETLAARVEWPEGASNQCAPLTGCARCMWCSGQDGVLQLFGLREVGSTLQAANRHVRRGHASMVKSRVAVGHLIVPRRPVAVLTQPNPLPRAGGGQSWCECLRPWRGLGAGSENGRPLSNPTSSAVLSSRVSTPAFQSARAHFWDKRMWATAKIGADGAIDGVEQRRRPRANRPAHTCGRPLAAGLRVRGMLLRRTGVLISKLRDVDIMQIYA